MEISPSGFPKRRTARKQLPKRTIEDTVEEQNEDKGRAAKKRKKEEEAQTPMESLTESEDVKPKEEKEEGKHAEASKSPESGTLTKTETIPVCKAGVKQKPQEEEQSKPPARGAKTLSSFFTPWKPAEKAIVKQEEPGTPGKEETKGLKMVETLSNLLRSVVALSPPDLLPVLYLSLNRLGPPQQGLELGVGDGVLLKAVAQATGRQLESIRAEVAEKGDVGLVAENSRSTQRLMLPPPPLTTSGVFTKFCDIARLTGSASMAKKLDVIKGLFVACRHSEARFIARSLSGRLRLGLAEQSVLAALALAVSLTPPGQGGEVKIFSRNQEDNTGKYPDIISRIPKIKLPSVTSFILDTEAVAWDREKKQIQPFQVLTTRKRKEVDASEIQVQVCLYAFDLICLQGESLIRQPLSRRRQLLRENFVETEGEFVFATSLDTKDIEQIAEFLEQSVKDSCEGLMVKTLDVDATYEIAKRSHNWLKLKKDFLVGVGDTLDLVVIGAYLGRGKRAGRYGGFLLAAYDEESEELQAICKALVLPTPRPYVRIDGAVAPDHWLDPKVVWEVKCADLSLSPIYPAARGLVDKEKGISLRFPRFIRVREDKQPEQATTSDQVACLYRKQSQIQNQHNSDLDSDFEDCY
ncbi:DNA ligase 1 [Cricetulus griseus]|uniref:DNA ligase 1 n=1 Tax=Cricetulus griseus TaxID=10029 RepID=G3H7M2_CRIGR|nr:DNA ligase 1 [Cricetulus griseus]